jgi:putative SOS response-associated peptidase YedK
MCANFMGILDKAILSTFYGAEVATALPDKPEAWPTGLSAFIRLDASGRRMVESGHFGLLPHFAKEVAFGRNTYNARSETVHSKNSFRDAWKRSQRCIVPAQCIFEPHYEDAGSKSVRWRISTASGDPMSIAGIYSTWKSPDGAEHHSFAMLTVNADSHPVLNRMHAPGEEKRMVVLLDQHEHDAWLTCSPDEAAGYFRQWSGALVAEPAPLPPKGKSVPKPKPPPEPDLFA